jgi:hypothetical protein
VRLKLPNNFATKCARFAGAAALLTALFGPLAQPQNPQNPDTMTPDASTAKARQVLDKLVDAFGGPTYMDIRDSDCEGRLARFGHNGELTGYTNFKAYWLYPDANRTDYSKKGVIINLYNGDQGWTLDKSGVSALSAASVADFQESAKKDINNLLRVRLKEPGMELRYGGVDVVDLKTVDWVDVTDADQRNFRLAVDQTTHLLVRSIVKTKDETMNVPNVDTSIYTNFQLMDGVRTAMQITSDRNGRRTAQVFFTSCKYNSLSPDLFTKAALEKRFSEVGSRKYKDEKKKEKEADDN